MNHKFNFILARVAAATLVAGMAAFVLFMIIKLLIMGLAFAIVVWGIKAAVSTFSGARHGLHGGENYGIGRNSGITPLPSAANAFGFPQMKRHASIIPIV